MRVEVSYFLFVDGRKSWTLGVGNVRNHHWQPPPPPLHCYSATTVTTPLPLRIIATHNVTTTTSEASFCCPHRCSYYHQSPTSLPLLAPWLQLLVSPHPSKHFCYLLRSLPLPRCHPYLHCRRSDSLISSTILPASTTTTNLPPPSTLLSLYYHRHLHFTSSPPFHRQHLPGFVCH